MDSIHLLLLFQHTAARRRLVLVRNLAAVVFDVSTHSRPKAAGRFSHVCIANMVVSTHSRPKAAGRTSKSPPIRAEVSTHSRPKAAGRQAYGINADNRRFNTQPPEGGWQDAWQNRQPDCAFQHTAARRRLGQAVDGGVRHTVVSTHSRPKAAGIFTTLLRFAVACFNTQPPEGGWVLSVYQRFFEEVSTHSRPKAAGCTMNRLRFYKVQFQHTAARRRLAFKIG